MTASPPLADGDHRGEVLSRHWTTDGVVTYRRRPTGGVSVTVTPSEGRSHGAEVEVVRAAPHPE